MTRAVQTQQSPARLRPRRTRVALLPGSTGEVRRRLDRLVEHARGHRRALILTHDNPDPDSLASGVALAWLLERLAGVAAVVAYGGIVGRAENRALIKVLKLPVVPLSRVVFDDYDLIAMVDTQPEHGNHSLPSAHFPDVVIDHHPPRPESQLAAVADVGRQAGATSTVVTDYLRASGLEVPSPIATALFYGIKSDTRDLERETTRPDVEAYLWLFPQADPQALSEIEHPRLPEDYFRLFHTAVERALVFDDAVVCDLGKVYYPDLVAEVADRFLAMAEVRWSLAFGLFHGSLYFSLRTRDRRMNAGKLIRDVIETRGGSAGGHGSMAGARLAVKGLALPARRRLVREVVQSFLEAFGVERCRPRKLV
ncbi:MAG TPA: bifunctional oligoribonuclease/PAP phosphatase NrnA [Anaeromyxobacteraceae bacterium]|nr:bifunctional oligoribonuclease/PAP phosphatase NrnA [Anaeromyxobacteraceae bacterium]